MKIEIPQANTHNDVAKEQHLVPRTYMRKWSHNNSDSIYVFDKNKKEKGVQPANVNSINYIVGFHDIKAGDVFVPDEALEELFGFVKKQCKVICGEDELDTLRKLNDKFYDYDNWQIYDGDGVQATRKEKNEIKRVILQSRYTFIETQWCYQYEDNWVQFIEMIEWKVRNWNLKVLTKPMTLSSEELVKLMEYVLIYDFRNSKGNAWINQIIDDIFPKELAEIEIPNNERVHKFNKTIGDEVKYEVRIRAFYEYLRKKNGKIKLMINNYLKNMGIKICLTTLDNPFITSETPSMVVKNIDGLYEHIFVATPTMLITTYRTDNTEKYIIANLKKKYVNRYNKYIAQNSELLITYQANMDIEKIMGKQL
ncbi:MAG: DUF4238 domain-containing protein [Lachnospiraceae bacterium]|nr:DUF4238 domain-containing protein [Lachnospiraceae bacterium]